ncbi:hypothetical protein GALL_410990 [mine drainage metagenome]|uniref:Uncharacterized protein n=1 Tax=mine drainage metagenome TaxID=410659 RepID=A0A1J5QBC4_9ZZZZ
MSCPTAREIQRSPLAAPLASCEPSRFWSLERRWGSYKTRRPRSALIGLRRGPDAGSHSKRREPQPRRWAAALRDGHGVARHQCQAWRTAIAGRARCRGRAGIRFARAGLPSSHGANALHLRKRAFLRTLDGRAFWGLIWAKVAPDQAAVVVLGKLKGSRSVISALSARCGNSVRTWRSQANGSTPQARQVSMRL